MVKNFSPVLSVRKKKIATIVLKTNSQAIDFNVNGNTVGLVGDVGFIFIFSSIRWRLAFSMLRFGCSLLAFQFRHVKKRSSRRNRTPNAMNLA